MTRIQCCLTAVVFVAAMGTSTLAQTPAPEPSTAEKVQAWSQKQWNTAKKEWAKDKAKWADCQKQSKDQKLKGRKSWTFLYNCMTG